jgi:BTB/POZ domain
VSEALSAKAKKRAKNDSSLPTVENAGAGEEEDPDATVVVGGKEFREHSNFLCYISGYFRGAIRSGMQESATLHFSFPDKDPSEWELFMSFMKPGSQVRVTKDNVEVILMWCAELCVSMALEDVARVLSKKVARLGPIELYNNSKDEQRETMKSNVQELLRLLGLFETYCLDKNKQDALAMLDKYINNQFDAFDAVNVARFLDILREKKDDDCYSGLRVSIASLIPSALSAELRELPRHEICLPHLIVLELEKKEIRKNAENRRHEMKDAITDVLPDLLFAKVSQRTSDTECNSNSETSCGAIPFGTISNGEIVMALGECRRRLRDRRECAIVPQGVRRKYLYSLYPILINSVIP